MTAPKYSDWIAHNATPKSTCPPDAVGKRVQVQCANETRLVAEGSRLFDNLDDKDWRMDGGFSIIAYRILIEPVRGIRTLTSHSAVGPSYHIRLPTIDGALIPGEYIGPDGATIVVGVV